MIFIFAAVGNRLFAKVMLSEPLNQTKNFQSFGSSFITLIISMTGEGWYEFVGALAKNRAVDFDCLDEPTFEDYKQNNLETLGCGHSATAYTFFVLYIFIVGLILVNLFIAVTLQGFNDVQREDSCRVSDEMLIKYINIWTDLDPDGTGYIHISEVGKFFKSLIQQKCELFPHKARKLVYDPN